MVGFDEVPKHEAIPFLNIPSATSYIRIHIENIKYDRKFGNYATEKLLVL